MSSRTPHPPARAGGDRLRVTAFARGHLAGALDLFAAEGWDEYTDDPERSFAALMAPGSTMLVALDGREKPA